MTESRETERDGRLILAEPVNLPDVLDVLIVGGGPFGTAAAFRAKELGLAALVIDYDDLMKRIRDYAKDKQILPDYGGGDRMQFPKGGPLVAKLHFKPIDKDRMCVEWKALYREHGVPAQVGVELTSLERDGDVWNAVTWNHNLKSEQIFKARHVVLAFGRGVPRRLDIPGDVAGLAFALSDPAMYVGEPVCVIGGGTSAGEAVIAISNAKAAANDSSCVYWSYRGDKMPKVSRALADVFFEAFMGNGNIRYLPSSEPVAMLDDNGRSFLSLRTSRVAVAGKPAETTQLEFSKTFCIACIGEDIPEALLTRIGVPLVAGGPSNKTRPVVTPLLETRQPNVYLAGDILSPAYFETTDFARDPSTFVEVKRRGNIKAAMRDGVLVADVIAQKLAGRVKIDVQLEFEPGDGEAAPPPVAEPRQASIIAASGIGPKSVMMPAITPKSVAEAASGVAAAPPPPPTAAAPIASCSLVSILPSGVEANEYPLKPEGATSVGRNADVSFPQDQSLSDVHAVITVTGGKYILQDQGSEAGVLFQSDVERAIDLDRGAVIRAGRQWLVVGDRKRPNAVVHYNEAGQCITQFELKEGTTVIGRQSPDRTIAPEDGSLSRRHLSLTFKGGVVVMKDLGSANGTQVRVTRPMRLRDGDRILLGQQVLEFRDDRKIVKPPTVVSLETNAGVPLDALQKSVAAAAPSAGASADTTVGVFFEGPNQLAPCAPGQTICEAADKAGIALEADCHQGVCGMDPVKILSGAEQLNAIGGTERSTLEDLCSLEPGPYRLACMARVSGRVKVAVVKQ
ncbi:MAG TPA: FHA domain-containing protein [Vicinamibacterales bacterium]|nr:FHA domain-containing protein [Vicinamibacterales bacterium]